MEQTGLLNLTADIVAAHVSNNRVPVGDMPDLVRRVHDALAGLGVRAETATVGRTPAVSIKASLNAEYLDCLECGRRSKMLRSHLRKAHGLTPEQYREVYGLRSNYPMTAPDSSKRRAERARASGVGRQGKS